MQKRPVFTHEQQRMIQVYSQIGSQYLNRDKKVFVPRHGLISLGGNPARGRKASL